MEIAKELLGKLENLTLVGRNSEGQLEWIGDEEAWEKSKVCEYCDGQGTITVANGEDDWDTEVCFNCNKKVDWENYGATPGER